MAEQAMLGRLIAAVGLVLGVVAIFVDYFLGQKYADDGTVLAWLLILAGLVGLCWLGAWMTGRRDLDLATAAFGGIMFGFYLLLPVFTAFDQWDLLDTGAWLGVCSGLIVVGALWATWKPGMAASKPAPMGMLVALAGLVLVFVAIWLKVESGSGTYWNLTGLGHSAGIFLIILSVLSLLALFGAQTSATASDAALALAAITFGFMTAVVVGQAFNDLGQIKVGGWLGAVGGVLALVGVAAMRRMAMAGAEAPAATPAPPSAA